MSSKVSLRYVCQQCGHISLRWQGQCGECQAWNSYQEEEIVTSPQHKTIRVTDSLDDMMSLRSVQVTEEQRIPTKVNEFDRVLGGGFVEGSIVLLGGDPGIGKSTLALQAAHQLSLDGKKVLYVTGEESVGQLSLRAKRLGDFGESLYVLAETNVLAILKAIKSYKPDVFILDSIQVIFHPQVNSVAGSVMQVRQCATELINVLKKTQGAGLFIGHITKDGSLAGPKVLEHLVDVILYLEGERNHHYRLLRSFKNRYSNTYEMGIFSMEKDGLKEVPYPSELFMDDGMLSHAGSMVGAVVEGSRVMLVEVQALVVESGYGMGKRTFLGVDANRANLLIAAMEKIAGVRLSDKDIILNIVGGVKISEPALDLPIVLAIMSSLNEKPLSKRYGVFGEVSLTGEIRSVPHPDKRLTELEKMGFKGCILPYKNADIETPLSKVSVEGLEDAIKRYNQLQ